MPLAFGVPAKQAALIAPTDEPTSRSGTRPASTSERSMPTCTAPKLPPPASTNAVGWFVLPLMTRSVPHSSAALLAAFGRLVDLLEVGDQVGAVLRDRRRRRRSSCCRAPSPAAWRESGRASSRSRRSSSSSSPANSRNRARCRPAGRTDRSGAARRGRRRAHGRRGSGRRSARRAARPARRRPARPTQSASTPASSHAHRHDTKAEGTGTSPSAWRRMAQCIASSPRMLAAALARSRLPNSGTAPR